jgi:tetratricopeptide (TPR) repeat protein
LQDEVARAIADEIKINLQPGEKASLAEASSIDPEAHDDYLESLFYYYRESSQDLPKAIEYVQRAIQLKPDYAEAYALLAACYYDSSQSRWGDVPNAEAARKAKATAVKALELNNSLAEPHVALGAVAEGQDWDWAVAESEFKRAIELDPNLVQAHVGLAWHLTFMRRGDAAIEEVNRAVELDPVSAYALGHQLLILFYNGKYDQVLEKARKDLELFPDDAGTYAMQERAYEAKEMYADAVTSWQQELKLEGESPKVIAALADAYKSGGIKGVWRWELDRLLRPQNGRQLDETTIAALYSALGEKDKSFEWLEKEYVGRGQGLLILRLDPRLNNLRSDPRFQNLLKRMNLPF